ncbi:Glutamine cyclotransferase [Sphingobacterium nematocida]|uniref:Glutamine cyclotransferase n=1 Tax=Sphingobacterium nematocida TaxID=1513896 RepID=A0A1T5EZP4_9SPHI|nr:glutaminyl-peptide cyclotransferase [Sphingobacterium nematocida]SKB89422.1 Glutamine cyclotransferase [Sphingobacterium nematocida]
MKKRSVALMCVAMLVTVIGCKTQKGKLEFVSPDSGKRIAYGEQVKLTLNFPNATIDSVVYSIDGNVIETKRDTASISFDTKQYGLGDRSLSAKVYAEGKEDIAYSNVMVVPPNAKNFGFEVVNTFPHDSESFTQGLQYQDGVMYESSGRYEKSQLRKVDLQTGKVLKSIKLDDKYFAEGMTIVDGKIVLLTWQENIALIYNKDSFVQVGSFNYSNSKEGWGLTYDGERMIKSDGTNRLYFLNAKTGTEESSVAVYDENGAVDSLNELEFIDGKVYANVYGQEVIVIIDPKTGAVEGRINLVGMYDENRQPTDNELNGIAYDHQAKRLFVTGKLWSKLFEIKLVVR